MNSNLALGANYLGNGRCHFCVWAPQTAKVEVHLLSPKDQLVPMVPAEDSYYRAMIQGVLPESLYVYRLDGDKERPDPASHFQPQGVHGPSQVIDPGFDWTDECWSGLPLQDYIIYELHVGTFSTEGSFGGIIAYLENLKALGITAIELMPIAQFPGSRNWGYDGVYPFAVQNSYGGPGELKRLVNTCHEAGLAVVLDVVYNHLGPEGNYLRDFGPYFTDQYQTPWGAAVNFDGPHSDAVRYFFVQNALRWLVEFHIDALRLDALHAIMDFSVHPFAKELATEVHQQAHRLNRRAYVIGESDKNDARLVRSSELEGYGLDALWNDDFHHALHVLLTNEQNGYYQDFVGLAPMTKALTDGFVYTGQYSVFHKHSRGSPSRDVPASRLVVFSQNHDQVGNRMLGERLSQLVHFDDLKLAAAIVLLSPFIPLLFMGEEYGEAAPFLYFTSYLSTELAQAAREGRRKEFAAFVWREGLPDPQEESTFMRCKLDHKLCHQGEHQVLLRFYEEIIKLRKQLPALSALSKEAMQVIGYEKEMVLFIRRGVEGKEAFMVFNFSQSQALLSLPIPPGHWRKRLDSAESQWLAEGSHIPEQLNSLKETAFPMNPKAFVLFSREE